MSKVLYIKANPKPEELSRTFQISDKFIEAYKRNNPTDQIVTLDLYQEDIKFLTTDDINTVFGRKTEESRNHPILKYAYEFAEVDKYVVAAPMWNLGIPAILKAYFDYVCVTGITFKYTDQGAVGLCTGKKAISITTRGGQYSTEPFAAYEMGVRYLKTIFSFLGVTDFVAVNADELDVIGKDVEAIMNKAIQDAYDELEDFSKSKVDE